MSILNGTTKEREMHKPEKNTALSPSVISATHALFTTTAASRSGGRMEQKSAFCVPEIVNRR